jgi:hypothetical protein
MATMPKIRESVNPKTQMTHADMKEFVRNHLRNS